MFTIKIQLNLCLLDGYKTQLLPQWFFKCSHCTYNMICNGYTIVVLCLTFSVYTLYYNGKEVTMAWCAWLMWQHKHIAKYTTWCAGWVHTAGYLSWQYWACRHYC